MRSLRRRLLRRLVADRRGAVSIELAFIVPLACMLLAGSVEAINYVLIHQKLERTSANLSDLVSQSPRMTEGLMRQLFLATDTVMQPYDLSTDGVVRVSSITERGGSPQIDWQRASGGGHQASALGPEGGAANLPAGLVLNDGDNVIICEAWFVYQPLLLSGLIPGGTLYRDAVFRPRFGKLDIIHP